MKPADVFIAVLVAVIWGLAFVASRIALDEFSPELMTTLRFAIAAIPCLFVRKPDVSWPLLFAISFALFLGQFLAQAFAIAHGVPVGLTSVIVQSQALFTIAFAALLFRELPTRMQAAGIAVATIGLLLICGTVGDFFSVGAFAVGLISPVSFAIGNHALRRAQLRGIGKTCLPPPRDWRLSGNCQRRARTQLSKPALSTRSAAGLRCLATSVSDSLSGVIVPSSFTAALSLTSGLTGNSKLPSA